MSSKQKLLDVIVILRKGGALTAADVSFHCDVCDSYAMQTLHLLAERNLVEFAGWGVRRGDRGTKPATWRWI